MLSLFLSYNEHRYLQPVPDRGDSAPEKNITESSVSVAAHDQQIYFLFLSHADQFLDYLSIPQENLHFAPPVVERGCELPEILLIMSGLSIERIGAEDHAGRAFHHMKQIEHGVMLAGQRQGMA